MKTSHKLSFFFILLISISLLAQGCFMFRKKNRCGTCPNFHSAIVEKQHKS